MAETFTINYNWTKPEVGASVDNWGGYINADLDGIDATVKSVSNAVPLASSTTPLMDGTAAVGVGTTFARADHAHPFDTSRYAASNPSGYQTAAQVTAVVPVASSTMPIMDGIAAAGAGTTWARADHIHPTDTSRASVAAVAALPVAMNDNRLINGNFAINQRTYVSGTALATTVYAHDRWKAGAAGCTYTFTAALPDTTITITAGSLTQVIEAGMIEGGVYTLSWTGTAQARVYQGAPSGAYAASPVITASLPVGVNTIVEFNTGTVVRAKLEIGSVATSYNRQSLAKSMADCQRYYQILNAIIWSSYAPASTTMYLPLTFQTMRAAPTITFGAPAYTNASGVATSGVGVGSATMTATITAAGSAVVNITGGVTFAAEL